MPPDIQGNVQPGHASARQASDGTPQGQLACTASNDPPKSFNAYSMQGGEFKSMTSRTIVLTIAGLVAGGLLAFIAISGSFSTSNQPQATVTGKALVGGPFSLTDHTGRRVTDKDFLGHYMLVFFGFTNCPDICPAGLQVMSAALDKLGTKGEAVTPIFITLDGTRDTPDKLAAYLKSFNPRIVGLTGSDEDLAATAKAYRLYFQKVVDDKSPGNYTYDHAAIFYLMGKDGTLITPIPHTTDVDKLVSALNAALS
jgi:protein SCO1/2